MSDKRNSKWRPPPRLIYYFCRLWSHDFFLVAADDIRLLQNFINLCQSVAKLLLFRGEVSVKVGIMEFGLIHALRQNAYGTWFYPEVDDRAASIRSRQEDDQKRRI